MGSSSIVALLGLGLVGAHFVRSQDGQIVREAISNTEGQIPSTQTAHAALARFGGLIAFVIVATIMAEANDSAARALIAFFVFLLVIWGMVNLTPADIHKHTINTKARTG